MSSFRHTLWIAAMLLASACAERPACHEGDYRACECDDGTCGFAACDVAAGTFGACGSCGVVPGSQVSCEVDEGTGGAGGGPTQLGFLETCTVDEECETGLCFTFNAKGPKCSKPCQTDSECPPPSSGCNMKGVCKAP